MEFSNNSQMYDTLEIDINNYSEKSTNIMAINITTLDEDIIKFYNDQIILSNNPSNKNSGFDLVVTTDVIFTKNEYKKLVPLGIKCMPQFNSGYYLYPRSSIYKSDFRMANCVGIIDMNYRGEIMAPIDCIKFNNDIEDEIIVLKKGTKLFQLCHPSLCPMKFIKCDESELDITDRGKNGFGSSGISI